MGKPIYSAEKAEARKPVSALAQVDSTMLLKEGFSAWADVYDQQQNPLLALEERYLSCLLPALDGRDVLDVGCGTGRWLARFSKLKPRSLHGSDLSAEMLAKAAGRGIPDVQLSISSCSDLPLNDASADLVLVSFVLSYVDDLTKAAKELARVARPGSDLFLSDMHPETATHLGWKRSFRNSEAHVELPATHRSISEILDVFKAAGFIERAVIEPAFGTTEQNIFAAHNKLDRFTEAAHLPAIYLLHLTKPKRSTSQKNYKSPSLLRGGKYALGANEHISACITIDNGNTESLRSLPFNLAPKDSRAIDLTGYLLFPGLINAHDHLEFALFPKLGRGSYQNAAQWAQDIHQNDAEIIAVHRRISKRTRLWWGGVRNLLSGVTTVCHHNPVDPCLLDKDFPVRVISRFGWEHSLHFSSDLKASHDNTPENQPFVIHACEGIDEQSRRELLTLDNAGVLSQRTLIVHGLSFTAQEVALLNARGSALILCPSSNDFLFGRVPSQEVWNSVERLALGSDSPLTAAGDLLDEIRFAVKVCALAPQKLYSLVTDSAASILGLKNSGSIRPDCPADFFAVRERGGEPAENLCSLSANDIELVLLAGRVQLASESIFEKLPEADKEGLQPLIVDGSLRWLRAPIEDLLSEAEDVLGKSQVRLGGRLLCRP